MFSIKQFLLSGLFLLLAGTFGVLEQSQAQRIDPSDLWFRAYVLMKEGEELERQKKALAAYNKFVEAKTFFDAVAREYPEYNPSIVRYRRKELADKLSELKNFLRSGGPSSGAMPGDAITTDGKPVPGATISQGAGSSQANQAGSGSQKPGGKGTGSELPTWNREFPNSTLGNENQPPRPNAVVRPPESQMTAPQSNDQSPFIDATRSIQQQFQQMDSRIQQLETRNRSLDNQVAQKEGQLQRMQQQLTEAHRREQDLKRQFELLKQEKGKSEDAIAQITLLKKQLSEALDVLENVNRQNREIIVELEKTRTQLAALKEERDELEKERNQLAAIIESSGDSTKAVARLTEANSKLRKELSKARSYAESLTKFDGDQRIEIEMLKEKIDEISQERAELIEENERHESHIAELESRLKQMSKGVVAMDPGSSPEALEENRLLRGVVLRQLRRQAQIKQARHMILSQLDELGVESETLMASLDVLSAGPGLTDEEKKLFKQPQMAELVQGMGDAKLHGAILVEGAQKGGAPVVSLQDLNEELEQLQKVARLDFREGRYEEAGRAYRKFLQYMPDNVEGICNLATVQMQLKEYDEAEKLLKKSLNIKKRNGRAYYLLGVVQFEQGNMDDALKHFGEGLEIDPKNAKAHNCVGVISSKKGWVKRAEESFVKAVSIDPEYADAHFNLSILYTSGKKPDREKGRKHYLKALDLGLPRDARIEEVLES